MKYVCPFNNHEINVIFCKGCEKHGVSHHTGEYYCRLHRCDMPKDGFCSVGKEKENDDIN